MDVNSNPENNDVIETQRFSFSPPPVGRISMFEASDEDYETYDEDDSNGDDSEECEVNSDSDSEYGDLPEHRHELSIVREVTEDEDDKSFVHMNTKYLSPLSPGYQFEPVSPSLNFLTPNESAVLKTAKNTNIGNVRVTENSIPEYLSSNGNANIKISATKIVIPEIIKSAEDPNLENQNKTQPSKPVVKRPFLKKGVGLSRFYGKAKPSTETTADIVPVPPSKTKTIPKVNQRTLPAPPKSVKEQSIKIPNAIRQSPIPSPDTSIAASVVSECLSDTEVEEGKEIHLFELMEALVQRPSFKKNSEVNKKVVNKKRQCDNVTEELKKHNSELYSEKTLLEFRHQELTKDKADLITTIEELLRDKNEMIKQTRMFQSQREAHLRLQKSNWEKEKKSLLNEKEKLIKDNEVLAAKKGSLANEKIKLFKENEKLKKEEQELKAEKEEWLKEKKRISLEIENLMLDKKRFLKEKEVWVAEKKTLAEKRNPSGETGLEITENRLPNGDVSVKLDNGTIKYINKDGLDYKFLYRNGDIKELQADGSIKYFYSESQVWHTTQPDGIIHVQFPDGQTETLNPDGSKKIVYPNKVIRNIKPNGTEEYIYPDETVAKTGTNGIKQFSFPNGQAEFHFENFSKRVFPDGTVKVMFSDGSTETKYLSGRIRTKDPSGKLIYDSGEPTKPDYLREVHKPSNRH